ncbi:hypothetical protein P43SY_011704 [Pythium insidiosum]|uniref:ribonuclease Z n=1 Tax=Pythium insidiosum TaxID=114742 RepID=A0AAD5Q2C1_PYTIN|nr:hypothetical protein P43SY_011704 [Pythium insidiosum]
MVDKALALGVPKGRLFGQLHQGKDVTLPDGRVVRPADCVSPSLPGSGAAIVACPSVACVSDLVASPQWDRYRSRHGGQPVAVTEERPRDQEEQQADVDSRAPREASTGPELQLQVVFHLADASVLQHPQYVEWVQGFGPDVEHVLLRYAGCAEKTVYRASALLQAQLHAVFPAAFPSNDHERRDAECALSRRVRLPLSRRPAVLGESMLRT